VADDHQQALGPFFTAGALLLLAAGIRRSARLAALGAAVVAADFSPPARRLKQRLRDRGARAEAELRLLRERAAAGQTP
jgi:hypothetical protein